MTIDLVEFHVGFAHRSYSYSLPTPTGEAPESVRNNNEGMLYGEDFSFRYAHFASVTYIYDGICRL